MSEKDKKPKDTHPLQDEDLQKIWDVSAGADEWKDFDLPGESETEDALKDLHIRLETESQKPEISGYIHRYSRYLVAAVALILFGAVLFFMPRNVTAPYGEIAELELPDGSLIELNSGTTVQFNRLFGVTNRTLSLNGEAWFDVKNGNVPFIVKANGTVTEVTGTEFSVRSWADDPGDKTRVAVKSGSVLFFPEGMDQNRVNLTAGYRSTWSAGSVKPEEPAEADMELITGWRERMFVFYDEPLGHIFREVERRFGVRVDLENSRAATETLTGYYRQVESVESLLDDICTVAGLNYARTANGFRVY
ncbi:FecR family protein [Rhodohalobacter sp. SW132]|uniref:FecR family protein n=1 Tax=Rhodohalobacter sp. SW132 TaxID=2293433 RepID=UPI0013159573|nr:FecR domain-containing protein [Rhodohalobacter sp. SW132]